MVTIDSDEKQNYETNSRVASTMRRPIVSLLNLIPKGAINMIKRSNKSAKHVVDNKTSHAALETLYHEGKNFKSRGIIQEFSRKVWFGLDNSKAVRNRLKLVRREINHRVDELLESNSRVNTLSIASGSARSVIEAVSLLESHRPSEKIHLYFLDKSEKAIEYSKKLAKEYLPNNSIKWIADTANSFPNHLEPEEMPHLVEMVGLLDYFDREKTLKIFRTIYENLQEGGYLVTANVADNHEREFLTKVIGWDMIYKTPEELADIAREAGFDRGEMKIVYEPLRIHFVLIARK